MTKLYELLAVEKTLNTAAKKALSMASSVFGDGRLLKGSLISFHSVLEDEPAIPDETILMTSTVKMTLSDAQKDMVAFIDVASQKESTNSKTSGIVEINGIQFLGAMPAPALLNLESRLEEVRRMYEGIPTIDMTEQWEFAADQGVFVSPPRKRIRTKKVMRNHTLAAATKEHPAQVQVYQEDIPAYNVETTITSGMLTPVDKASRLARIDQLAREVKKARIRANDQDITDNQIGEEIFAFIDGV